MFTISNFMKENYKKFSYILIFNIFILIIYLLLFYCRFEVDDDYAIRMIVSGGYGIYDYHTVYINVILGKILSILYENIQLPWYEILMYSLLVLSFSLSSYVLLNLKEKNSVLEILILFTFLLIFSYINYVYLTFTQVAGICASAGSITIFLFYRKKENRYILFLGIVAICFGFLIRYDMAISCISISSMPLLFYLIEQICNGRRETKRLLYIANVQDIVKTYIFILMFFILAYLLNNICYLGEEWNKYITFNGLRAKILDHYLPSFNGNEKFYNSIGMNIYDFSMLKSWNIYDRNIFNIESFKKIKLYADRINTVALNLEDITNILDFIFVKSKVIATFVILILILCLIDHIKTKKIDMKVIVSLALYIVLMITTYLIRDKRLINHVFYPLTYSFCLVPMMSISFNSIKNRMYSILFVSFILCICYWQIGDLKYFSTSDIDYENNLYKIYKKLSENENNTYLLETDSELNFINCLFVKGRKNKNIIPICGWTVYFNSIDNNLIEKEIEYPYRDIINKNDTYIITNNIERTILYIRNRYCEKAKFELFEEIDGICAYKIFE